MYHPSTTMTSNRHRVVSVDGYWAPEGNNSALAADVSTKSARRDLSSLPLTTYSTTIDHMSMSTRLQHHDHAVASSDPTLLQSRRSHRPRGCRGGRKNRKVKSSNNDVLPARIPYDDSRENENMMYRHSNEAAFPLLPSTNISLVAKGDLSPYQHLRITNKPWSFGAQDSNNHGDFNTTGETQSLQQSPVKQQQQMLPPPVPSALFDSHRQNLEAMNQITGNIPGSALKMLPSFDEDEDKLDDGQDGDSGDLNCSHRYGNDSNDDDDDSSENFKFGVMIPKPPYRLGEWHHHHTPSRHGSIHDRNVSHIIPSIHFNNDSCEPTEDTCNSASSSSPRSRCSSSSTSDRGATEMICERNLVVSNSNNFNSSPHQPPSSNSTTSDSHPKSKAFRLPIFNLHVTPPPIATTTILEQEYQEPSPGRSTMTTNSCGGGGFGSLFVTSPRSFLFGIGHTRINSARPAHITHHYK
jgi:hypothetical protein